MLIEIRVTIPIPTHIIYCRKENNKYRRTGAVHWKIKQKLHGMLIKLKNKTKTKKKKIKPKQNSVRWTFNRIVRISNKRMSANTWYILTIHVHTYIGHRSGVYTESQLCFVYKHSWTSVTWSPWMQGAAMLHTFKVSHGHCCTEPQSQTSATEDIFSERI